MNICTKKRSVNYFKKFSKFRDINNAIILSKLYTVSIFESVNRIKLRNMLF